MQDGSARGVMPGLVHDLIRPLPRLPLSIFLTHMVRRLAYRCPEVFERLSDYSSISLMIDPIDLPIRFRLLLDGPRSRVDVVVDDEPAGAVAHVRAPLLVLLGLLDGTYDADALFFSRDLAVEGDTEVVLAVRNAIEEADLRPAELVGLAGSLARIFDQAVDQGLALLRRRLGAPTPSILAERRYG